MENKNLEAFIKALAERIKNGEMTIEQIPESMKAEVQTAVNGII